MTVKKKLGKNTGIYQEFSWHSADKEGIREILDMVATPLEDDIAATNTWAKSILHESGYEGDVYALARQQNNMDTTEKEVFNVLWHGHFLLEHLKNNKIRDAVWCATRFGAAFERAHIRPWERHAVSGKKSYDRGTMGGYEHGTPQVRKRAWEAEEERLKRKVPGISGREIARRIAKKFGDKDETIRRHLRGRKRG